MNPLLQQALSLHQSGRLGEADALYQQALRLNPTDFLGQHFFGVLRMQQGRFQDALVLLAGAIRAQPNAPDGYFSQGQALMSLGRFAEAVASFDRAAALKPGYWEAYGLRGAALFNLQRLAEAVASFDKALAINPRAVDMLNHRGMALRFLGRAAEALESFNRSLALQPNDPAVLAAQGGALGELSRLEAALASCDKALALAPSHIGALCERCVVLVRMGRLDEALLAGDRAIAAHPQDADAWNARCGALKGLGRLEEALASVDRAVALQPGVVPTLYNRALILRALGRPLEALAAHDRLLAMQPDYMEAWNERGDLLQAELKRPDDALASFARALAIRPGHVDTLNNIGVVLWGLGRIDEAMQRFDEAVAADPNAAMALHNRANMRWARKKEYEDALADLERVLRLDPGRPFVRGDLLHLKMYGGDWAGLDEQMALVDAGVRAGDKAIVPFAYEALSSSPADLKACAEIYARGRHPATPPVRSGTARLPGRIRVGYVSGEFREQATQHLCAGLYERHDRERFEIVAFDAGSGGDGSAMRRRLEGAFDRMIDIASLGDLAAAERVAAEDIDILVNLNGYFGRQRMGLFAARPAPVQVNFLGFPGTLGAPYMDYILADRWVIPEAEQGFYTEKVVYLPDSYQVNDDRRGAPHPLLSRAWQGLPDDAFVFCHFNQSYKITPAIFAVWMRILRQVEGSVLWLLEGSGDFAGNLRRAAAEQGVAPERLVFAPFVDHQDHLARLALGDLFLDCLPYNAHTTASDCLWMGVPLVTCTGSSFPGRVATSLLHAAGLPDLIAADVGAYEALAVELARSPERLAAIRERLVQGRATCALFDTDRFRRHIEAAYATMLETWQRGEPARGFSVPPVA